MKLYPQDGVLGAALAFVLACLIQVFAYPHGIWQMQLDIEIATILTMIGLVLVAGFVCGCLTGAAIRSDRRSS